MAQISFNPLLHTQIAPFSGITQSERFRGYKHAHNIRTRVLKSVFFKLNLKHWVRPCNCHTVLLYASCYPILLFYQVCIMFISLRGNEQISSNQMRLLGKKKKKRKQMWRMKWKRHKECQHQKRTKMKIADKRK